MPLLPADLSRLPAAPTPVEEAGHQLYAPRLNGSPPVMPPGAQPANMLMVPQPAFFTSKLTAGGGAGQPGAAGHTGHANGLAAAGRKYQCKMCPQVSVEWAVAGGVGTDASDADGNSIGVTLREDETGVLLTVFVQRDLSIVSKVSDGTD